MSFFMGIGVIKLVVPMYGTFLWLAAVYTSAVAVTAWASGLAIAIYLINARDRYLNWTSRVFTHTIWPWMREAKWRISLFFAGVIVAAFI